MKAPLIITVGPPCSGKTSWLRRNHPQALDVALDDQPGVYMALPRSYFLDEKTITDDSNVSLFGIKIADRIAASDQAELCLVIKFLSGTLESKDDFTNQLCELHKNNHATAELIVSAMESARKDDTKLPDTVDLFVRQALFLKNEENESAIERATRIIRESDSSQPVAWGNTNTKPRDYAIMLEYAAQSQRPVEFCVYADQGMKCYRTLNPCLSITTSSGISELYQRNIQRFLQTGRYIPAGVVSDMYARTEDLLSTLPRNLTTKEELSIALIEAAGFRGRKINDKILVDTQPDLSSHKRTISATAFDRPPDSKRASFRPQTRYPDQSTDYGRPHPNRETFRHPSGRGGDFLREPDNASNFLRGVPYERSDDKNFRWRNETRGTFQQAQDNFAKPRRPWDKDANFHRRGHRGTGGTGRNNGARPSFPNEQALNPPRACPNPGSNANHARQLQQNEGYQPFNSTRQDSKGESDHSGRHWQSQHGRSEHGNKRT